MPLSISPRISHFSSCVLPLPPRFSGEVDLALTVTDAFMVGKANGRRVQLLGTFVESPLVWAVATTASIERENISTIADLLSDENLGAESVTDSNFVSVLFLHWSSSVIYLLIMKQLVYKAIDV